jgi:hypothetical protein
MSGYLGTRSVRGRLDSAAADTGALPWRESIISEFNGSNVQLATEGAAKNNITQVSRKARNSIFDTRMILRSYSRFQIGRKD